jgi:hypothetical protein
VSAMTPLMRARHVAAAASALASVLEREAHEFELEPALSEAEKSRIAELEAKISDLEFQIDTTRVSVGNELRLQNTAPSCCGSWQARTDELTARAEQAEADRDYMTRCYESEAARRSKVEQERGNAQALEIVARIACTQAELKLDKLAEVDDRGLEFAEDYLNRLRRNIERVTDGRGSGLGEIARALEALDAVRNFTKKA